MKKKPRENQIVSVLYGYVGTDSDFTRFLRSTVHDFVSSDTFPDKVVPLDVYRVEKDKAKDFG